MAVYAVETDPNLIKFTTIDFDLLTSDDAGICYLCVQTNVDYLQFIKNPSEHLILCALEIDPTVIKHNYIKQTDKMRDYVMRMDPTLIENIYAPNESHMLRAVETDYTLLRFIIHPTLRIKMLAFKKSLDSIQYFQILGLEDGSYILEHDPELIFKYFDRSAFHFI